MAEVIPVQTDKDESRTNGGGGGGGSPKKNRIQVSNTKKPLFFYVNLAKKYMRQHNEVELSALGMAIATVVTISEILKNNGFAIEKKILTSTVDMRDETKGKLVPKAKIEILLGKSENFDNLVTAAANIVTEVAATVASDLANATNVASEMAANVGLTAEKKEDEKDKVQAQEQPQPQPKPKPQPNHKQTDGEKSM